jgi:predicted transcriptional regulator
MFPNVIWDMLKTKTITTHDFTVLAFLFKWKGAGQAEQDNKGKSYTFIAEGTGVSLAAVKRSIDSLCSMGLIQKFQSKDHRGDMPNSYWIDGEVITEWKLKDGRTVTATGPARVSDRAAPGSSGAAPGSSGDTIKKSPYSIEEIPVEQEPNSELLKKMVNTFATQNPKYAYNTNKKQELYSSLYKDFKKAGFTEDFIKRNQGLIIKYLAPDEDYNPKWNDDVKKILYRAADAAWPADNVSLVNEAPLAGARTVSEEEEEARALEGSEDLTNS